jgi:hypothetical protein
VRARVRTSFGELPVVVQTSPEDASALWVQVFAVPVEQVRGVKDLILQLQSELPEDDSFLLLPMVKDLAVTQAHYPQYMLRSSAAMLAAFTRFFEEQSEVRYVLCHAGLNGVIGNTSGFYGLESLLCESPVASVLKPRPAREVPVAANSELALAA